MKRLLFLIVLLVIGSLLIAANGQFERITGSFRYTITFDTAGIGAAGDDTTQVDSVIRLPKLISGWSTLHSTIIANPPLSTSTQLTGDGDSIKIWLYTAMNDPDADTLQYVTIDSIFAAAFPCTLYSALHSNLGDTLMRDHLYLRWQMYDTLNDSVPGDVTTFLVAKYPIQYNIVLK